MQKFIDPEQEQEDDYDTGITIPKINAAPDDSLIQFHEELMDIQDEGLDDKKKADAKAMRAEQQRRGGVICCCGTTGCRIGPMRETQ